MQKLMIAILLLACFAAPVSAGCAWVLWEYKKENVITGPGQWRTIGQWYEPLVSFEKLSECNERNETALKKSGGSDTHILPNGNLLMYEFHCLPDTVDPR